MQLTGSINVALFRLHQRRMVDLFMIAAGGDAEAIVIDSTDQGSGLLYALACEQGLEHRALVRSICLPALPLPM